MVEDSEIKRIAEEHDTPFYLVDRGKLEGRHREIETAFPQNTAVAYATKANYTPSVIRTFRDLGTHFDVFSPGELELLLGNGCEAEGMIYTSVAETPDEFEHVLGRGVERFVLGSIGGIINFGRALKQVGVDDVELMLRIQPVERVQAAVSTSGAKSKFGTILRGEGDSVENAHEKLEDEGLKLAGFHFHLGTQIEDPDPYLRAIDNALEFAKVNGIGIRTLDIGGGYPVKYGSEVPPIEKFGKEIGDAVDGWRDELGNFELVVEPGRFLTAGAVDLVVEVVNVKRMYGRQVIVVDGSEDMVSVDRHETSPMVDVIGGSDEYMEGSVAGNLCHSGDWLVEDPRRLPAVEIGDLIAFRCVGAYVINHNIPYNLRKVPKVLTLDDGGVREERHPLEIIGEVNEVY